MDNKYRRTLRIILSVIMILSFTVDKAYGLENDDKNRTFKNITIDDGLSQSSVSSIIQDSKGYMWIGTLDGLNKYNGREFQVYKYDNNNSNTIVGNCITDIKEDFYGNIWVGTTAGLSKINPSTNKVTRYIPNEKGCNISHYRIRQIMIASNGDILVATDDGLNKYDETTDNFIRLYNSIYENDSLSSQEVSSLAEDLYGNYWIGTRNGLNKINKINGKIEKYFANDIINDSISNNFIWSLYADELGYLWIGTYYGGLKKLNIKTGEVEKFVPSSEDTSIPGWTIKSILRDKRGLVWVGTENGLAKLNEDEKTFTVYNSSKYNSRRILSNDIISIAEDKSGAIWIGTNHGISLFNPENLFNYYISDPFDNNSLSSELISGIYEDNEGILWVGTVYDGLNMFDREKNEIVRIDKNKDYDDELQISNNLIREITGIDNEIWIATEDGLNKYDKETRKITVYKANKEFTNTDTKALHIDDNGVLWIGTTGGLFSFDRKDKFTNHSQKFKDLGIDVLNFNDIHEDEEGILWLSVGLENGLVSFDKRTNEIKTYDKFNNNINGKNYTNIISINSDKNGNIWLGTDSGLIKYNKKTEEYIKYTESDGLPNNFIYGILFEDNDSLWVSTNYGISKFNIWEEKFINFDRTDGIQGNEFNQYSYFKSKSGEIFFGGINGLTAFRPENIKEKKFTTPVQIESIHGNYGKIDLSDEINLDYKTNEIKFNFFLPDYMYTRKIKYAYKLIGLDKDLTISEYVSSVSYANLEPGKYEFVVAARNSSGEWSEPTFVKINIGSPPWETPIAYLIYVLIATIIVYIIWNKVSLLDGLVKQRTLELNNKLKENEELYSNLLRYEKYKNNYFINLSHELRTPLNVISSAQNLIESLNSQNKEITRDKMAYYMGTIKRNCERLINLIDNILHTSKIEAGAYKLNIKKHDIVYLVEEAALSMKELTDEKGINMIIEPFVEEKNIECDYLEIERVIINLISNAVKFTKSGGTIQVYIWDLQDYIKISVKDTGIGISPKNHAHIFDRFSQEYSNTSEEYGGSGLGLTLSRQLIELHGGKIWVESEVGQGSEFIIELPVIQSQKLNLTDLKV